MSDERNLHDPGEYHRSQVKSRKDAKARREATGQRGQPVPEKSTIEDTQRRSEAFSDQPDNVISPTPPPITEEWRKGRDKH